MARQALTLPPSLCPLGYPIEQLEAHLSAMQMAQLHSWMTGQTGAICDGTQKDPDPRCVDNWHGLVYYAWDVERWIAGLPILDW